MTSPSKADVEASGRAGTQDEALLPCPFCGGSATLVQQTDTERPNVTWIACSLCNCMTDDVIGEPKEQAAALAIELWNIRSVPAAGALKQEQENE